MKRLLIISVTVSISLGCTGCFDDAGRKAAEDIQRATNDLKQGMNESAQKIKDGMQGIDPLAIKQLIDTTNALRNDVERLRTENQALTEQLQGKVPTEAVGSYTVRDPNRPGATAKIVYHAGNQFQFTHSDGWSQTFVWDKAQQCFLGPNSQDRVYYFRNSGVLAFESQSFWVR